LQNGKLVSKAIEIGLNDGQNVQVVAGLTPGDKVVIGTGSGTTRSSATGAPGGPGGGGPGGGGPLGGRGFGG
jgi:hypothetical protein